MAAEHVLNVDLAKVRAAPDGSGKGKDFLRMLAWGDDVEVLDDSDPAHLRVRITLFVERPDGSIEPRPRTGFIKLAKGTKASDVVVAKAENRVLNVSFVDVQQGDGTVIETPRGRVILVDGGDNQLFARYLAARFRDTTVAEPKRIDCIVVTHGDADHFLGLTEIRESEKHKKQHKRLFIHPLRVFHNGLAKRPSKDADKKRVPDVELLGETVKVGGKTIITGLVDDIREMADADLNVPFRKWRDALNVYTKRYEDEGGVEVRRLVQGDDDAFDFLADEEDLEVEVLGPILSGQGAKRGFRFLGKPAKGRPAGEGDDDPKFGGFSASHTINGHSIILRLRYGGVHILLAGDLNEEAELDLVRDHAERLRAEVFKVPHHGSADFSREFLEAVAPTVSVISSGDESSRKEYIHPRASLVGALGRFSPGDEPLIFVTEMVAFFEMQGYIDPECHKKDKKGVFLVSDGQAVLDPKAKKRFFAFSRTAFGIVKVRTDGRRLLVFTDSGLVAMKEAYAYEMKGGVPKPVNVRQV